MLMGSMWSALFFLLAFLAAITSSIPLLEVSAAYFPDHSSNRHKVVILVSIAAFLRGIPTAFSLDGVSVKQFGMAFLDVASYLTGNIMMPIIDLWTVLIKVVAPVAILVIFVNGFIS